MSNITYSIRKMIIDVMKMNGHYMSIRGFVDLLFHSITPLSYDQVRYVIEYTSSFNEVFDKAIYHDGNVRYLYRDDNK